jgi:uncharacterized protein (TIGR01777 family)
MTPQLLWPLIALQIAMGAFDSLYHHEIVERLAWRPTQRRELVLHALRSAIYAALFLMLGFAEPHGFWAVLVIAALAVEVALTLLDFVEEDMSRRLPASERINHTLLAINYGAILALLIPILVTLSGEASALQAARHGPWSLLAAAAAAGAALLGLREILAARRAPRLAEAPAETLTTVLPRRHTVLVTGATGFIGRRLVAALAAGGHQAIVLTRDPARAAGLRPPFTLITSLDQIPDGARIDAIVNLAGEPTAGGRWTQARREKILGSRLDATRAVLRLIRRLDRRPAVLISASAIGWYGLRDDTPLTEEADSRPCFSHDLCAAGERAAMAAEDLGVRVVTLRIGLVLGRDGGMLSRLLTPFELGLGGPIGSGRQWMSWIERDDLIRLIAHVLARPELAGPVNACAPAPVRNAEFAVALGRALGRPALLRIPAAALRFAAGQFADELLLGGQRVLPARAEAAGFHFRHPTLPGALAAILELRHEAARPRGHLAPGAG